MTILDPSAQPAPGSGVPRPASLPPPGARPAIESLLLPLLDRAYGLARSLTRDAAEADDLLQEAALAACRGFASFVPGTNFKAWFYRILTNCHFARFRRQGSRVETVEVEEESLDLYLYQRTGEIGLHAADDPAAALLRKMTAEQVRGAVAGLPAEFQVAVSLFFLDEMSYEEIAAVLDCPVGTVRSRLHRGRKLLQKSLWTIALEAGVVRELAAGEARP
jgi:RNA polymerase sigma-70 factor, ECF subfamily